MNPMITTLLNQFTQGQLANHPLMATVNQMMFAADILKDVASSEKNLAKAHWCESDSGTGKTY